MYYYCERLTSDFWAEPVNAVTNIAFIIAAILLVPKLLRSPKNKTKPLDLALLIILIAAIGIGSFLWHTIPGPVTEWADNIPILLFISFYLLSFLYRIAELKTTIILAWFVSYHIFNIGIQYLFSADTLNGSIFYLPTLITLIFITLYTLYTRYPFSSYFIKAVIIFTISLVFRTIDFSVCETFSIGTHFIWHIMNAYVLYILTLALIKTAHQT
jgi:hypothetical protein